MAGPATSRFRGLCRECRVVLTLLGAFDAKEESRVLSSHGRDLARLPLHPRLAHLALKASTLEDDGPSNADTTVAELCALLEQERDVLQLQEGNAKVSAAPRCADARTRLLALKTRALPACYRNIRPLPGQCKQVLQSAARLQRELPSAAKAVRIKNPGPFLALAYPERVARRAKNNRFLLRDGTSCIVKDPMLQGEEFLAVGRMFRTNVVTLAAPLTAAEAAVYVLGDALR
ncbi:unnamed protein product [Symbiodinium pilosum]|uniref:Helicase-associated domain-containing protein n=1 Tax=Symbiodinium pilosum TaxID=2952 RepID=A0A812X3G7_SYMPI|nr:unnamed protein product [Symbiodinium pilosum]